MAAIITPFATLSFPTLFSPRPKIQNGELLYSCSLLFSPDAQKTPEFAALRAEAAKVFKEKFPDKKPSGAYANPFRNAAEKEYEGYEEGWLYISPSSKHKPGIVDSARRPILTADEVWAGQLVRAYVAPFAYEKGGNRGVSFGLNGIQIVKKDCPRLDGRRPLDEVFDDGSVSPEAAMAADADLPF